MVTKRIASEAGTDKVPALAERMHDFRSLGGNCEFGFVQRYCAAEPSGLFRFAFTPLDALIDAIETKFERYGAPDDLHLVETDSGTYYCASRCYNFWSNTQQRVGTIDPAALLEREYGRVAHLKRKMLDELASGSKILVRKIEAGADERDFRRLAEAVWRHGPSTLLRVREAAPGSHPEAARWSSDRILEGTVRRFAPPEIAWEVDLEPWVALCDGAYAAHHGLEPECLAAPAAADAMRLSPRSRSHRGRHREAKLSTFTKPLAPALFDPARPYVFSAWVRIPAAASPSRVFAVFGRDPLGSCDADLSIRDRWQRIWAAGRIEAGQTRPSVGLAMVGSDADRFRSCGWRLHDGPLPENAAQPPETHGRSPLHWFTRWW